MSQQLDAQTQANLLRAHTKAGARQDQRKAPFRNIRDVLALHSKVSPRKPFLIFYDEAGARREYSYAEFTALAHQAANFFYEDLGLRRGDRVATISPNHSDNVIIYFACWVIGAAVAPQNVAEDDRRIAFILRNSEAKVCLARAEYMQRAEGIISGEDGNGGAPNIQQIVQVGGGASDARIHFQSALRDRPTTYLGDDSGAKAADLPLGEGGAATAGLDDEALLVYTSGTTGSPKGVILSQYNLLVDAQGIAQWQAITGNQRTMCVLPIHHVNGIVVTIMAPLTVGGSTVLNSRFSASRFWERIAREGVNVVSVVPTLLQFLIEYGRAQQAAGDTIFGAGINRRDLRHFRHFICGAGTLSVALAKEFSELFGFTILHGYGLSESTCYSCFLPISLSWAANQRWLLAHGYPSIGCPIEPNEMAIFSADGSGERLAEGERGEICIRGHNIMQGYFKRPDANAETFKFGWFRSGDEGFFLRGEGGRDFFFITGRIKELINRGGVKFSPFDIEESLLAIDGVKAGLAIAFPNVYYGEEVGAYIVPEAGAQLTAAGILDACRAQLTFEKSPKAVVFGSEIPVTSTGKYQRLKLQGLFAEWEGTQFRR
ncbi:MAG: class I adenylate-forming enzyme family protein [Chloroflexi bacterium]|nr:class I adenylate-forming enzyme family protein [Chloroflexota bacterium]MCY3583344.1 class I adenylate-forming enzyme family protein [Chloroflexota bacterium]MCY3716315.1 class I adenylate-forming enzyme family protein [Chloroflexota bacterium]MDE2651358.1 class I adenylate-forming enzyme family protein [Chloroflexota bacterium]MXX82872.1 acyl--CoA ligase [Chloroflexota bacterium]